MLQFLALDLHRDYIHVCRLMPHPDGAKIRHSRFPNTPQAWSRFIATEIDRDTWVAFEVTANAFEIHDLLSTHAGKVLVVKPSAVKERGSGRKTDRADTERLVTGLAQGTLPVVWVPPEESRVLRRLLRLRQRTDSRRKAVGNHLRALLRRHFIAVPAGKDVAVWLQNHPGTLELLSADDRVLLGSLLRQYRVLQEEVEALTAEVAARVQDHPIVQCLLTIPGVSLITAATIYAYLGDPRRFRGPKQVKRYAGLDPSVYQSGQRNRRGRTSKHGCTALRAALIEAAQTTVRWDDGPLGMAYRRLRQKKGHSVSVVAVAGRLLVTAWRMMLTGEPYRGERPLATQRKLRMVRRRAAQARDGKEIIATELGFRCAVAPERHPYGHPKTEERRQARVPA